MPPRGTNSGDVEAGTNYGHVFVGACGAAGLVIGAIAGYTIYARGGGGIGGGTAAPPGRGDVAAFANPIYGI